MKEHHSTPLEESRTKSWQKTTGSKEAQRAMMMNLQLRKLEFLWKKPALLEEKLLSQPILRKEYPAIRKRNLITHPLYMKINLEEKKSGRRDLTYFRGGADWTLPRQSLSQPLS